LAIDSRGLLEKVDIEMTGVGRVLGTVPPETPQGQGRFNSSLAAPFTMPVMVNPQPIMQSIEQQAIQPTDTPRHHQQEEEDEDSSLSELDDEDFRGFEITSTPGPAESATKKRKLASGIAAEDDKQERDCHCSDDSLAAWKKDVMKAKKYTIAKDINLLMTWYKIREPCFSHSKMLGSHLGLQIKHLNDAALRERLMIIYDRRNDLGKLKTDTSTYFWFRLANRPVRPSDAMGVYRFRHSETPAFQFSSDNALGPDHAQIKQQFLETGSVVVPGMFSWWWTQKIILLGIEEKCIADVVPAEFDMYRHHLREINRKENYGWLRNMFHGIGQQLMRQDPFYYAHYTALRPDGAWRLVSYPYYAKYALFGDDTFFRHIDVNIPRLLESGRGF
jgi:hypothetical protein